MTGSATSPARDRARARSPALPGAASVPSGSSSQAPSSATRPRLTAASTRTGSASSTSHASAASRTSPLRQAPRSRPSPPQPARPASASGTASPAVFTRSPPSATRRVSHGRLERLHPPRRRAAHTQAPRHPRSAQPQPRSPPARIRNAILTSQVRQLEATVGTALLRTGPDGRLTLTAYGQLFARDVRPALESLAHSRGQSADHAP